MTVLQNRPCYILTCPQRCFDGLKALERLALAVSESPDAMPMPGLPLVVVAVVRLVGAEKRGLDAGNQLPSRWLGELVQIVAEEVEQSAGRIAGSLEADQDVQPGKRRIPSRWRLHWILEMI
jgi:hypothetical protein